MTPRHDFSLNRPVIFNRYVIETEDTLLFPETILALYKHAIRAEYSLCMFNDSNFQRTVLPIDRFIDHSIALKSQRARVCI